MSILGVDLSSNNPVFDWALARQQGVRAAYIKLGGDNIPRYVSSSYPVRVDDARRHGMIVGHYWVTGGHDPEAAAQFFVRSLRNVQPGDFFVLDNETLDDGNMYSDDEAASWIRTVQAAVGGDPRRVFMYASGSPMRSSTWAGVRATGAQALVAWYGIGQWGFPQPLGHWPAEQIGGHQYSSSENLGNGGRIDANVFKDNAFTFTGTAGSYVGTIRTDDDEMLSKEAQDWMTKTFVTKEDERRESRGRLYYCATPPTDLPQFVIVFWHRPVGDGNVLYLNDGESQARVARDRYYQTADTVEQAKAAALDPNQYRTLINLALGKDSAFVNNAAHNK